MVTVTLDSVRFRLKRPHDLSWLGKYGKAFWAVDETGSGCVGIGMQRADKKYFCKIAGADTISGEVTPAQSVQMLKEAAPLYHRLQHPHLVRLVEHYPYGQFYIAVFEWASGECLFDHWNFEAYQNDPSLKSPKEKFRELSVDKKISAVETLFSFLRNVSEKGYVAVDFYDGSMIYDFATDRMTLCDIDLFRRAPVINDIGSGWYGTKRLKAPEEYEKGSPIDERTNLFTLGALIFDFFGSFSEIEIEQRYSLNRFVPCSYSHWQLNEESYRAAKKAVSPDRRERYQTFSEFFEEWKRAVDPLPATADISFASI